MTQCTCTKDKEATCIVHPTTQSLKDYIAELEGENEEIQHSLDCMVAATWELQEGYNALVQGTTTGANPMTSDKWIAVSERLPSSPYETVLIAGGLGYYSDGLWWSYSGDDAHRQIEWEVTHWMPLPEPPEAEE